MNTLNKAEEMLKSNLLPFGTVEDFYIAKQNALKECKQKMTEAKLLDGFDLFMWSDVFDEILNFSPEMFGISK